MTASNGVGSVATQSFSITVNPANQAPVITDGPPPTSATVGTAYSFTYTASGYPAPTYSLTAGNLPTGLSLSSAGVISGTPSADGTFTGTVTATNGVGAGATQNFSITIADASPEGDTPTMPLWGLAMLAALLVWAAMKSSNRAPAQ